MRYRGNPEIIFDQVEQDDQCRIDPQVSAHVPRHYGQKSGYNSKVFGIFNRFQNMVLSRNSAYETWRIAGNSFVHVFHSAIVFCICDLVAVHLSINCKEKNVPFPEKKRKKFSIHNIALFSVNVAEKFKIVISHFKRPFKWGNVQFSAIFNFELTIFASLDRLMAHWSSFHVSELYTSFPGILTNKITCK